MGRVTAVNRSGERIGTIRVEAEPADSAGSAKAVARVTQGTEVLGADGRRAEFGALAVAALSLLLPGWGQFEQGRPRLGWMQMLWALGASLALFAAPAWDLPRLVPGLELAGVTLWSVLDALLRCRRTRQWALIDPHVEPRRTTVEPDGRICVDVHQVVRDLQGKVLLDQVVQHVYTLEVGRVQRMEIRDAGA
ncbi:MAG: hypothetical protein ACREON_04645 [Gemmatimonadaceae bacterium]